MRTETIKEIEYLKKKAVWIAHERAELAAEVEAINAKLRALLEASPWSLIDFPDLDKTKEGV